MPDGFASGVAVTISVGDIRDAIEHKPQAVLQLDNDACFHLVVQPRSHRLFRAVGAGEPGLSGSEGKQYC
jgi:hypothetical protein